MLHGRCDKQIAFLQDQNKELLQQIRDLEKVIATMQDPGALARVAVIGAPPMKIPEGAHARRIVGPAMVRAGALGVDRRPVSRSLGRTPESEDDLQPAERASGSVEDQFRKE